MIVQLGYTRSDDRKIEKDFTVVKELSCTIRDDITIQRPRLLVTYDSAIADCNYMYIPEWERYYFISNITMIPGKMAEVRGYVDVLMSFADQIKALNVYAVRVQNKESPFFSDSNLEAEVESNVTIDRISTPFFTDEFPASSHCYLFTVLGGHNSKGSST